MLFSCCPHIYFYVCCAAKLIIMDNKAAHFRWVVKLCALQQIQ